MNYGGALEGHFPDNRYRRKPILKDGLQLELPIAVIVEKNKVSTSVFSRMKAFVDEYHVELEKMTVSSAQFEAKERMADDDLDEYGPDDENTVEVEQQNHLSNTGEDNIVIIEE